MRIGVSSSAYVSTYSLRLLLSVPTYLLLVGASKLPSVVRTNAEARALSRIVSTVGETTAQLPLPRRVRVAMRFACRPMRTGSAANSSTTEIALPEVADWSNVFAAVGVGG